MSRRAPRLVVASYVVVGAFGVHALRYALASGQTVRPAHGYLSGIPPLLAGMLALALARLACAAVDGRAATGRRLGWRLRWLSAALGFVVLYAVQENVEALTATGRLVDPLALLAHGGLTVVPLAAIAGGALAMALRGTEVALERLALGLAGGRSARVLAPLVLMRHGCDALSPAASELGRNVAGRAPPRRS